MIDADLAQRLKNQDVDALAELYDRYGRLIYYLIYRIVGNTSAAEDLVQESFLRVWNSIQNYDPARGPLARWMVSVARNRAIDYLRSWEGRMSQGMLPIHEWDAPCTSDNLDEKLLATDVGKSLERAMKKLTARQQQILNLAYVEGLTQSEIAEHLQRPLGTIKTWVRAALQELRTEMAPLRVSGTCIPPYCEWDVCG